MKKSNTLKNGVIFTLAQYFAFIVIWYRDNAIFKDFSYLFCVISLGQTVSSLNVRTLQQEAVL